MHMSDLPFALFPYDGILGIGLPESSVTPQFNLLGNLAEAGVFKNDRFALWLADPVDGEDSEITFGAFKQERIASEVIWMKVKDGTGLWQVPMEDFAVNNTKLGLCPKGREAALDTG